MATRQTSSSGRAKSPRIQVVLPEELCQRLADLADAESRTVSNMAKVLIQQGVERLERGRPRSHGSSKAALEADLFRKDLEESQRQAVLADPAFPLLISAGAGSGKTLVLTFRIAVLLERCAAGPYAAARGHARWHAMHPFAAHPDAARARAASA